jgi:hypothetical protein
MTGGNLSHCAPGGNGAVFRQKRSPIPGPRVLVAMLDQEPIGPLAGCRPLGSAVLVKSRLAR